MTIRSRSARLLVVCLGLLWPSIAQAQTVIVDHTSVALFEQIPEQYLQAAASLRMMFVDRSVGMNISQYLDCLAFPTTAQAPARCRRWTHQAPEFSSPPQTWSRAGGYPRSNWHYYGWPGSGIPPELPCAPQGTGMWWGKPGCFVSYVDTHPTAYQVIGWQPSYLEVAQGSNIASLTVGYFIPQATRTDIADLEAMQGRHPSLVLVHYTSSLARGIGSRESTDFNNQTRAYVLSHGGYLLDVADIEAHDPWGGPCYDNRDGVPYIVGGIVRENYPNDGQAFPAICQHYTSEVQGGHLGAPSAGGIRLAKAVWVLMARIAGWNP